MNLRTPTRNGPFKGGDADLKVIFWDAGGLSDTKFLEFKRRVLTEDADIYVIVEAGAATDTPYLYTTAGYSNRIL